MASEDEHRENTEFLKALAEFKTALTWPGKTETGFNYKYATLENILMEWEPIAEEKGFLIRQSIASGNNGVFDVITTKFTHIETGLSESSSMTMLVTEDHQHGGAGVSYNKRYTLMSLGKPQIGEDHDGMRSQHEAQLRDTEEKLRQKVSSVWVEILPKE